jgi:hypothetical protein
MNSLLVVRPRSRARSFIQKMAQKAPLKKMPSTAANATRRVAEVGVLRVNPIQGPLSLLLDTRNRLRSVKQAYASPPYL